MEATIVKKDTVKKAVIKSIEDKKAVRAFLKGNSSLETLTSKGIKLVKVL